MLIGIKSLEPSPT